MKNKKQAQQNKKTEHWKNGENQTTKKTRRQGT